MYYDWLKEVIVWLFYPIRLCYFKVASQPFVKKLWHLAHVKILTTQEPIPIIGSGRSQLISWCHKLDRTVTHTVFLKKWANPGLFFIYFRSFQTNNTIFTANQCEKMSCPSSIRCQDSNPQPFEHESPPITTRPGLLTSTKNCYLKYKGRAGLSMIID